VALIQEEKKGVQFMLLSVVGFAFMNLVVKYLDRIPSTELVLFRSIVSLGLSYYLIRKRNLSPWGNQKKFLLLRGLFGATSLTLFFYTLQKLPIGTAITLQYLSPIFTAFFAIFILKEKVRSFQWVFFGVSLVGIIIIKGFDPDVTPFLFACGIASAIFSGLAYNMIRLVKDTDSAVVVVFYFPLVAIPIMLIFSFFHWVQPIGWEWGGLLLMGLLTQFAQMNMTKALQSITLNKIAGIKYIGILFALSFDLILFDVSYGWISLIGILFVVAGVLLNLVSKR
jgi:drug/metabolite transporter (DMT)-like permease